MTGCSAEGDDPANAFLATSDPPEWKPFTPPNTAGPPPHRRTAPAAPAMMGGMTRDPETRYLLDNQRSEAGERFVALSRLFDASTFASKDEDGIAVAAAADRSEHGRLELAQRSVVDLRRRGDGHRRRVRPVEQVHL